MARLCVPQEVELVGIGLCLTEDSEFFQTELDFARRYLRCVGPGSLSHRRSGQDTPRRGPPEAGDAPPPRRLVSLVNGERR